MNTSTKCVMYRCFLPVCLCCLDLVLLEGSAVADLYLVAHASLWRPGATVPQFCGSGMAQEPQFCVYETIDSVLHVRGSWELPIGSGCWWRCSDERRMPRTINDER